MLKDVAAAIVARGDGQGAGVLLVDDLVDTGKTAKVVRGLVPRAHLATVYAKPMGRPLVDTFITEVSQDTWIYFPWDTGLAFPGPDQRSGIIDQRYFAVDLAAIGGPGGSSLDAIRQVGPALVQHHRRTQLARRSSQRKVRFLPPVLVRNKGWNNNRRRIAQS